MKNSFGTSLTFAVILILMVSSVNALTAEEKKALDFDNYDCDSDSNDVGALGTCEDFLKELNKYPELLDAGKELADSYSAWRDRIQLDFQCQEDCNIKLDSCLEEVYEDYNPSDLDACYAQFGIEGCVINPECNQASSAQTKYITASNEYNSLLKNYGGETKEVATTAETASIGVTGIVRGTVEVQQADGSWKQMVEGQGLKSGDLIRTRSDGSTKLNFGESDVTLGPNTAFRVDELDAKIKTFSLSAGKIWAIVQKLTGQKFTVNTPQGNAYIRGTEFIIEYSEETDTTTLLLHEGEVEMATNVETYLITQGNHISFNETGISSHLALTEKTWKTSTKSLGLGTQGSTLFQDGNWLKSLFVILVIFVAGIVGVKFYSKKKKGKKNS